MNTADTFGNIDRLSPITFEERLERMRAHRLEDGEVVHLDGSVIKWPIRWSYYAFVFALLFETANIGVSVKPTLIAGALLVLCSLAQPALCYRWPPTAFWLFSLYLYFSTVGNVLSGTATRSDVLSQYSVDVQLLFLFWISFNLMRYDGIAHRSLLALVVSASIVSALSLTGITHKTYDTGLASQRLSAFDSDPNNLAGMLAIAIMGLIGVTFLMKRPMIRYRLLAIIPAAVIGAMLFSTGSRGALVGLAVGLVAINQGAGSFGARMRNFMLVVLLMASIVVIGWNTPTVRLRFERTLQQGSLAKREHVYPLAIQLFLEKPVFGWGNVTNTTELGRRLYSEGLMPSTQSANAATFKATHNMILYVLTSSGIVGALPFCAAILLCLASAWRARRGSQGILPFAIAMTVLTLDMSVDGQHWKHHWIFMAYALASGYPILLRRDNSADTDQPSIQ